MNKLQKVGILAAALLCTGIALIQTDFAKEIFDKISKKADIEKTTVYESKGEQDEADGNVPEAAKGKIVDKDGIPIENIDSENMNSIYNLERMSVSVDDNGTLLTDEMINDKIHENGMESVSNVLTFSNLNDLKEHMSFKVSSPEYIPEGYKFAFAEADGYEKAGVEGIRWCRLDFRNEESKTDLSLQLVQINRNSQYSFNNTDNEKINGNDAIISDNEITWSDGEIRYSLFIADLGKEEGIKIAESIK